MQSKVPFIVISIVLIILAFGGGYYLSQMSKPVSQSATPASNSIFAQQSAMISGTVTAVNGRNLTVKSDSGQTGTFPAAAQIFINKITSVPTINSNTPLPTPQTNISAIEIGKPSTLMLNMVNGKYEVTSVTILPPVGTTPPPAPRVASPSAN